MFERFTERARQVVVLAQDEARLLKHNYIGTEHLLLGLLREEEGIAARVLDSLDITVEEARAQVARIIGYGDEVATGQIPITPRAKKVLELALRESQSLSHNYIGTEHILLGLAREGEGVANHVLALLSADSDTIRDEVIGMLSSLRPAPPLEPEFIAEVERVRAQKEKALADHEFEEAARLRARERRLLQSVEKPPPPMPQAGAVAMRRPISLAALIAAACVGAALLGIGLLLGWAIWG